MRKAALEIFPDGIFRPVDLSNSRTASPVIDGVWSSLAALRPIGARTARRATGFMPSTKRPAMRVWTSSPAGQPKDNSFSLPYLGWLDGKRVLYATTGDGSVVCLNARTGDPLWRIPIAKAGINASILVHNNDKVIAIYGTPYEPGQMVALKIPHVMPPNAAAGPVIVERSQAELWSIDLSTSTSSPILAGDRIYVVTEKGDLCSVDVNQGKILWRLKIGIEQRNSCPLYADGKIYVPMLDDPAGKTEAGGEAGTTGAFYIVKPTETEGQILAHLALEGRCLGTPTAYNGKVYMQTTRRLYCFGKKGNNPGLPAAPAPEKWPAPGPPAQLQIIPSEVLLRPGQAAEFRVRTLDAHGFTVEEFKDLTAVKWAAYIPPTARVRASMKAAFNAEGKLVAAADRFLRRRF